MTADLSFTLETNFKQESDKAITALKSLEAATKGAASSSGKSFKSTAQSGAAAIAKLKDMASYLETFHKSIPAGQEGMAESLKTMAKNLADSVSQIEAARRRVSVAKGMVNRKDGTAEVVNKWTENLKQATKEYNDAIAKSRGTVEKFYSLMSERDLQRKAAIAADKEDVSFRRRQLAASQAEYDLLYGRQYRDKGAGYRSLKADDLLPLNTIKEYQARGVKLGEIDAEFLKDRVETAKRARKMVEAATNSPAGEFQKYSSTGQAGAIVTAQEIQAREKYLALRKETLATGKAIDAKELQQLKEHGAGLTREHLNQVRAFEKLERGKAKAPELDPRAAERALALQTYRKYVADNALISDNELQSLKSHGVSLKLEHRNQLTAYEKSLEEKRNLAKNALARSEEDRHIATRNSAVAMLDEAHKTPEGVYQVYNSATRRAGSIVEPPAPKPSVQLPINNKPAEVEKLSKSFRHLTIDGNDAHSMARGLASGFDLLWLTWGNLAPLFAGSAISFGVSRTFSIGMEVEQNIKFLEVLGDKTKEQGSVIREELRKIDQSTLFSLTELSKAMVGLEQGGVSGARGLEVVKVAADLAAVGNTNLDVTSRLLMQTMNLFPQTTADVTKSAAQMFQVTKDGALNIEDIGDAMRYASTSGVVYGQTFEDVLVTLKALAAGGIKGTSAGTSWINFLQDIAGRSKPAKAALKELEVALGRTISTFDSKGQARAALDVLSDINEGLSKFKPQAAKELMDRIFNERGIRTAAAAIRDGTVDLGKYKEMLGEVKGEFLTTNAAQLMDTTKGALDILKGTMVGVLDKTFESMGTGFRDTIKNLTSAINSDEFANLMRGMVGSFAALADVAVRVLPVLSNIAAIFIAFKAVSFAQAAVSGLAASMVPLIGYLSQGAYGMGLMAGRATAGAMSVTGLGQSMLMAAAASRATAAGLDATAAQAAVATVKLQATTGVTRILAATMGFLANPIVGLVTTLGILGATWWATSQSSQSASEELSAKVWKDGKLNVKVLDEEIAKIKERNAVRAAGMEAPTTELDSLLSEAKAKWDKSRELRRKLEGTGLTEQQKSSRAPFMPKALADEAQAHEAWFTIYTRRQEILDNKAKLQAEAEKKRNAGVKAATEKAVADTKRQLSGLDRLGKEGTASLGKEGTAQQAAQNALDNDLRYNRLDEIAKADKTELDGLRSHLNSQTEALKDFRDANLMAEGDYQNSLLTVMEAGNKLQREQIEAGTVKYANEIGKLMSGLAAMPKTEISDSDKANRFQELIAKLHAYLEQRNTDIAKMDEEAAKRERKLYVDQYKELDKLRKGNEEAVAASKDRVQAILDEGQAADRTQGLGGVELEAAQARIKVEMDGKKQLRQMDKAAAEQAQISITLRAHAAKTADEEVLKALLAGAEHYDGIVKTLIEGRTALEVQLQTEAAVTVAAVYRKEFKRRTDEIGTELAGGLTDAVLLGGKEGGQRLRKLLEKELISEPFTIAVRAMVQPFAQAMAGFTAPGANGGKSAFNSWLSSGQVSGTSILQAGDWLATGSNDTLAGLGTYLQDNSAQISSLATSATEFLGYANALNTAFSKDAQGGRDYGKAAGQAIGTYFGPLGSMIGGEIGSALGLVDYSGTTHKGGLGSYSRAGGAASGNTVKSQGLKFGLASKDYKAQTEQASIAISATIASTLDATAEAFGSKAGYYVATGFADDISPDGAWGAFMVKLADQTLINWKDNDKWPGRGFADGEAGAKKYAATIGKDMRDYLVTQTPDWADSMLMALGDAPSLEGVVETAGKINQAAKMLEAMGRDKMTDTGAGAFEQLQEQYGWWSAEQQAQIAILNAQGKSQEALNRQRELDIALLSEDEKASRRRVFALEDQVTVATEAAGLQKRLNEATMTRTELLALERAQLDPLNQAMFDRVIAAEEAAAVAEEAVSLQKELNGLTMTSVELRAEERKEVKATNLALFDKITAASIAKERSDLTATLEAALGNSTYARTQELSAIDATNRAIQQHIWAIADATEAANSALQILRNAVDKELSGIQSAYDAKIAKIDSSKTAAEKAYTAQKSLLDAALSGAQAISSALQAEADRILGYATSMQLADNPDAPGTSQSSALAAARMGDTSDATLRAATSLNVEDYASWAEYATKFYEAKAVVGSLASAAARKASDSYSQVSLAEAAVKLAEEQYQSDIANYEKMREVADQQLKTAQTGFEKLLTAAQAQLDETLGTKLAVLGLQGSLSNYSTSLSNLAAAMSRTPGVMAPVTTTAPRGVTTALPSVTIPAFAVGGSHSGGWAMVGERGPELAYMPPAHIYPSGQSTQMLDNSAIVATLQEVLTELRALRATGADTKAATEKTASLLDQVTAGGNAMVTETL